MANSPDSKPILRWVRKKEIRHWRSGKMMRRKDGEDFVFPIRRKKK